MPTTPRRRTLVSALQASTRSDAAGASASCLRLSAYAGSRGMVGTSPPVQTAAARQATRAGCEALREAAQHQRAEARSRGDKSGSCPGAALSLVAARIQQVENLSTREKSHPTGGGPPCVGPGGRPRGNDRMSCLPWSPLERFRLWCGTGFGAAKVSSRRQGKPKAPRAFADPFAYRSWFAVPSLHASQMRSSPSGGRPRAARGASPAAANAPRRCGSGRCSKGSPGRRRPGSRGCSSAGRGD